MKQDGTRKNTTRRRRAGQKTLSFVMMLALILSLNAPLGAFAEVIPEAPDTGDILLSGEAGILGELSGEESLTEEPPAGDPVTEEGTAAGQTEGEGEELSETSAGEAVMETLEADEEEVLFAPLAGGGRRPSARSRN
jgi:hypothetical protein